MDGVTRDPANGASTGIEITLHRFHRRMRRPIRAVVLGGIVMTATLLGGCGLQLAPYDGRLSCQGAGGTYTADGRCLNGGA